MEFEAMVSTVLFFGSKLISSVKSVHSRAAFVR